MNDPNQRESGAPMHSDVATDRSRLSILRNRAVACLAALTLALMIAVAPTPAAADQYDSKLAGHPLRIAAYVLHPVGAILEILIVRPAHWLINREPVKTLVGHTDKYAVDR